MSINHLAQKGIALIQVLLITAILSVLAIYLTHTARDQITLALWSDDKAQAIVNVHSTEAQLLFNLLTQPKIQTSQDNQLEVAISQQWNFYAKPFTVNESVSVSIQDQAGLLSLHYPNRNRLRAFIKAQGFAANVANQVVDSLLDWQDLDSILRINGAESSMSGGLIRNGAIPDVHDLLHIKQISPNLFQLLIENATIHAPGYFNPINAPEVLLLSLINGKVATQIIQLRVSNQLTPTIFSQLTGIVQDESTYFYPSNFLSIQLESQVGDSVVKKEITIQLKPYAEALAQPVIYYSNRG